MCVGAKQGHGVLGYANQGTWCVYLSSSITRGELINHGRRVVESVGLGLRVETAFSWCNGCEEEKEKERRGGGGGVMSSREYRVFGLDDSDWG